MQGYLSHLKGLVELDDKGELKIVVLENLIVRRELEGNSKMNESLQTELLVNNGQVIEPKTPIAKTEVLASDTGKLFIAALISFSRFCIMPESA